VFQYASSIPFRVSMSKIEKLDGEGLNFPFYKQHTLTKLADGGGACL
jgi:hypothetical protein